jgi:N-acetylmuramoyl-L-alanine amidase/AmpD protein
VSTFARAWHAGASIDKYGRRDLNDFTVGIEIVNLGDGKDPWTKEQVEAVHHLCRVMVRRFPIKQITSHEYIAIPKGRKNDPKGFPWDTLKDLGVELVP